MSMIVTPEDIKSWLEAGFSEAVITVSGDGRHFEATIVSDAFDGLNAIKRHQKVYQVLGERMKEDIHALSLKTLTPDEAA